jgi:GNAT superfamily N-acetyltransferase
VPVREAEPSDVEEITTMVLEHAEHESAAHLCLFNAPGAAAALFGERPVLRALIAYPHGEPETAAGLALWYPTFSSWAATHGIWVEDLYVRPAYRRHGLGRELLGALRDMTAGRVEWDVHVSNGEARGFYEALGAEAVTEWTKFRWTLP